MSPFKKGGLRVIFNVQTLSPENKMAENQPATTLIRRLSNTKVRFPDFGILEHILAVSRNGHAPRFQDIDPV